MSVQSIRFLTLDEVLHLHAVAIEDHGGGLGLRDIGLLESAIAQPCAAFGGEFLHADLAEMATAYVYHIVLNHPFVDGNKRAGAFAMVMFLDLNGHEFTADDNAFVNLVLDIATGSMEKDAVAAFVRDHMRQMESREGDERGTGH